MKRVLKRRGRDKLFIIAEILEIAKDGALKTQIMYRANLSFSDVNAYLGFMLEINFLKKIKKNAREGYKSTEKGIVFLNHYRQIQELLRGENEVKYVREATK